MTNKKYSTSQPRYKTLLEVFDDDLQQMQHRIGVDRTQSTYVRHMQMRNSVAAYIADALQASDIMLTDLTPTFISDFAIWLSIRRHYSGGTIWLTCQQLKSTVTRAFQAGWIDNNPFYNFHVRKNIRPRQYLTEQELTAVIDLTITDPLMRRSRDLFVFSALTGMAFADICQLSTADIQFIGDQTWIFAQRKKTHTSFQVRLLPQALHILRTYEKDEGPIFGSVCYRTLAKHIPQIVKRCGIRKHITFHCARHTFAITALNAGMPIESISRILGHSNLTTTQIYARITTGKLSADMDRLQTFYDKNLDVTEKLPNFAKTCKVELRDMEESREKKRGYAVGVQEFEWMRQRGSLYIDKTEYIYKMVSTDAVNFFLSRPRRFGKSLLVDTLQCYFEGCKDLFEGLYIYNKEEEWKQYPVIRLDFSNGKYFEKDLVHGTINAILEQQEEKFGITDIKEPANYDVRLTNLIKTAQAKTGLKVVVLVDEYDAPMLDTINNPDLQDYIRQRIRLLFSPLKSQSRLLRFVFLTGISKFSQLSVFSELNNLQQLTFSPEYEAICGITEEELLTQCKQDIKLLTEKMNNTYSRWDIHYTYDDIVAKLKQAYDGYHFCNHFTDIYCPWSLVNAFAMGDIQPFWFSTGTPTMLINIMRQHNIVMPQIEGVRTNIQRFDAPTERISDPIPVLFQSGYLTLKAYDPIKKLYTLGFPNEEVREGFAYSLYQYYMADYVGSSDTVGNAYKNLFCQELSIQQFIEIIRKWYAGIPYSITDKNQRSAEGRLQGKNEQLYQSLLYAALIAVGADVYAEEQTSDGRMDLTLKLPYAIYILEFKYNKTAEQATLQIVDKDYAVRFAHDERPVYAIGLNISSDHRTIEHYQLVQVK